MSFLLWFLWRSQHEQLWKKDYREYTLKDILGTTKHSFSWVQLLLSKFCEFLFGEESPAFWLVLPNHFFPSSGSTPKTNSLCFWRTVEPVGGPQLSGTEATALGSATQWGSVIWNCIIFLLCFSTLFRFFYFDFFPYFCFFCSDFWLCIQHIP